MISLMIDKPKKARQLFSQNNLNYQIRLEKLGWLSIEDQSLQDYYDKEINKIYKRTASQIKREILGQQTKELIAKSKEQFRVKKDKQKHITKISKEITHSINEGKSRHQIECIKEQDRWNMEGHKGVTRV